MDRSRGEGNRGHLPLPPSVSGASRASLSCLRPGAPCSRPQGRDVWVCRGPGLTLGTGLQDTATRPPMSRHVPRKVSVKSASHRSYKPR